MNSTLYSQPQKEPNLTVLHFYFKKVMQIYTLAIFVQCLNYCISISQIAYKKQAFFNCLNFALFSFESLAFNQLFKKRVNVQSEQGFIYKRICVRLDAQSIAFNLGNGICLDEGLNKVACCKAQLSTFFRKNCFSVVQQANWNNASLTDETYELVCTNKK